MKQDVLNEFSFAPGNPWEAIYVVKVTQGAHLLQEGLLFTSREPISPNLQVGSICDIYWIRRHLRARWHGRFYDTAFTIS